MRIIAIAAVISTLFATYLEAILGCDFKLRFEIIAIPICDSGI